MRGKADCRVKQTIARVIAILDMSNCGLKLRRRPAFPRIGDACGRFCGGRRPRGLESSVLVERKHRKLSVLFGQIVMKLWPGAQ